MIERFSGEVVVVTGAGSGIGRGTTNTDILSSTSEDMIAALVACAPQGAFVEPEEVAALVSFLASDEAPHIAGGSYVIHADVARAEPPGDGRKRTSYA